MHKYLSTDALRGHKGAMDPLGVEERWELNLGPLQGQSVLLTTEPSLHTILLLPPLSTVGGVLGIQA